MKITDKSEINKKANEIIALFIEHKIPLSQQLEILKIVRQKIEFCRNTANEIKQPKLF
jgi:hypothetical protein